jgi:hypothetical protein
MAMLQAPAQSQSPLRIVRTTVTTTARIMGKDNIKAIVMVGTSIELL